jgi:alpha,alpha-trehalase
LLGQVYSAPYLAMTPAQGLIPLRFSQQTPQPLAVRSRTLDLARFRLRNLWKIYPDNKLLTDATARETPFIGFRSYLSAFIAGCKALLNGKNPLPEAVNAYIKARFVLGESLENFRPRQPIPLPPLTLQTDNSDYAEVFQAMHQSWPQLIRQTAKVSKNSLIPLPNPYVVPGGRFTEMYYWDSYFILRGLMVSGMKELAKGMVDNMLYMSEKYGIIPNANRTYYLSRSQPPLLTSMINLVAPNVTDQQWHLNAYKTAKKEYNNVWRNPKTHYVSALGLDRYFDPIPERRKECVSGFYRNKPNTSDYYLHNRAECESGWDFTKRFDDRCADFLPIDLNSLLYKYETDMAKMADKLNLKQDAAWWTDQATQRGERIQSMMWDEQQGMFFDYDFKNQKRSNYPSLASFFPLWAGLATPKQAEKLIGNIHRFEAAGGLKTSLRDTGEQWDGTNGWPNLQWMVIKGIRPYDDALAKRLARKWLDMSVKVYRKTGTFFEKYNVALCDTNTAGHYPSQGPFGWGIGVNLAFLRDILGYKVVPPRQDQVA